MVLMSERIFTSPAKYIQGKNSINNIGAYVKEIGNKAAVIADDIVWEIAGHQVVDSLKKKIIDSKESLYNGESSEEEFERITHIDNEEEITVVIDVGGGKTLDAYNAIAYTNNDYT